MLVGQHQKHSGRVFTSQFESTRFNSCMQVSWSNKQKIIASKIIGISQSFCCDTQSYTCHFLQHLPYKKDSTLQWILTYPDPTYPYYSLIWTHVWEPIPIPQQKVPHLSGNSVNRTRNRGVWISEVRLYMVASLIS